jgi:hypothetical protein
MYGDEIYLCNKANQKTLGAITDQKANQYFKIWFGNSPFNAKLKQQLLNP